jgi:hypothetical protein
MSVQIKPKFAGVEGASVVGAEHVRVGLKVLLVPFMLEDYLDAIDAKAALADAENSEPRVPWSTLKDQLGL